MFTGYIYDVSGDFNVSFYTMGGVGLVAGLLSVISAYLYHTGDTNMTIVETKPPEEINSPHVLRTRTESVMTDDFGSQVIIPTDNKITS